MTTVSEIMTTKVVTVPVEKGLKEVVNIMANSKISSIIITQSERVMGILTERDLIKKVLLPGASIGKAKIEDVMTRDPMSVNSHTDLAEASQMMRDKGIRHLPVIDNEKLVGLVTQTDIVKETHKIQKKNVHFMTYQNIQTIIIVLFFLFLIGFLVFKKYLL